MMKPKVKAREIAVMGEAEARLVWPTYIEWAMQLFEEETPVQDRCYMCGAVLCTYPTAKEDYRLRARSKFGPMTKPRCGAHGTQPGEGEDE